MKINSLQIENVKRVKAVKIEPTKDGLTIIGGNNNQGKTSVLDSIAWALGGNKFKPTSAQREDSILPPNIKLEMDNGLIVERKGKNSDLKVIDPSGQKAGQALLDSFIEELALNLPKFMDSSNKEKADTLLQIIGVGDQLFELEKQEQDTYNQRHAIGQIADRKEKFAKEQPYYPDAPKELVSATDLIKQQQMILAKNGENQKKRLEAKSIEEKLTKTRELLQENSRKREELENQRRLLIEDENQLISDLDTSKKTVAELQDESTAEIESSINNIEEINIKVRANFDKERAEMEAEDYREQYQNLTSLISEIRQNKYDLLTSAKLPLEGLFVEEGELTYKGHKWDSMSGSEQLKVATAIVRAIKPDCQFVLMDKLEQMDLESLQEFGEWAKEEGLQIIATRVSTGDEVSLIIEDGYVKGEEIPITEEINKKWEAGKF